MLLKLSCPDKDRIFINLVNEGNLLALGDDSENKN